MSTMSTSSKPSGHPGSRDRRSESIKVRMSKTISYILRHGAAKEGLAIRTDGYVLVADLLARPKLKELDFPGLLNIVDADQKRRYQLGAQLVPNGPITPIPEARAPESTFALWIRANQGHTLKVEDLDLKPVADPAEIPCAVHGTTFKAWESIKTHGLSRMRRNHVHLASGRPGQIEIISGIRNTSQILIFIDISRAMAAGMTFYISSNGVILTPGDGSGIIPPVFFSSVEERVGLGWEKISAAAIMTETKICESE